MGSQRVRYDRATFTSLHYEMNLTDESRTNLRVQRTRVKSKDRRGKEMMCQGTATTFILTRVCQLQIGTCHCCVPSIRIKSCSAAVADL